jgi:hypothetical protein
MATTPTHPGTIPRARVVQALVHFDEPVFREREAVDTDAVTEAVADQRLWKGLDSLLKSTDDADATVSLVWWASDRTLDSATAASIVAAACAAVYDENVAAAFAARVDVADTKAFDARARQCWGLVASVMRKKSALVEVAMALRAVYTTATEFGTFLEKAQVQLSAAAAQAKNAGSAKSKKRSRDAPGAETAVSPPPAAPSPKVTAAPAPSPKSTAAPAPVPKAPTASSALAPTSRPDVRTSSPAPTPAPPAKAAPPVAVKKSAAPPPASSPPPKHAASEAAPSVDGEAAAGLRASAVRDAWGFQPRTPIPAPPPSTDDGGWGGSLMKRAENVFGGRW